MKNLAFAYSIGSNAKLHIREEPRCERRDVAAAAAPGAANGFRRGQVEINNSGGEARGKIGIKTRLSHRKDTAEITSGGAKVFDDRGF